MQRLQERNGDGLSKNLYRGGDKGEKPLRGHFKGRNEATSTRRPEEDYLFGRYTNLFLVKISYVVHFVFTKVYPVFQIYPVT